MFLLKYSQIIVSFLKTIGTPIFPVQFLTGWGQSFSKNIFQLF